MSHKINKVARERHLKWFNKHKDAGTIVFDRVSEVFDADEVMKILKPGGKLRVIHSTDAKGNYRSLLESADVSDPTVDLMKLTDGVTLQRSTCC